jgi:hypothetical protein
MTGKGLLRARGRRYYRLRGFLAMTLAKRGVERGKIGPELAVFEEG